MFKYFILFILLLFISFCISPSFGVLAVIVSLISFPIILFFSRLEEKRNGRRIGRVDYYADSEYDRLNKGKNFYCTNCGNLLNPSENFCSKCGKAR